jgi:protein-L-isoaspartate O-methyltransferase
MRITSGILEALGSAHPDGHLLHLDRQLPTTLYQQVDAALQAAGGRWDSHRKAHVFPGSAWDAVTRLTAQEEVTTAREAKQTDGWFATPPDVVEELLQLAGPRPGMLALEPSAGEGAIAAALAPLVERVDCIEQDPGRFAVLQRLGDNVRAYTRGDFLAVPPHPGYDLIVMNPPFAKGADVRHVRHALRFLRPGGRLAAVMSAGVRHRDTRGAAGFRALVQDRRGWFTDVDPAAFASSGTSFRTVIVTIPGAAAARSRPVCPFEVRAAGRRFLIAPLPESFLSCDDRWTPVTCRDVQTGLEAQTIVRTAVAADHTLLMGDDRVRDAIGSACRQAGKTGCLPAGFTITFWGAAPRPPSIPGSAPPVTAESAQLDLFGEVA